MLPTFSENLEGGKIKILSIYNDSSLSEILSVCRKMTTFCFGYFLSHARRRCLRAWKRKGPT